MVRKACSGELAIGVAVQPSVGSLLDQKSRVFGHMKFL